jgi:hypothetical protein
MADLAVAVLTAARIFGVSPRGSLTALILLSVKWGLMT